jgi:hypothetical protein
MLVGERIYSPGSTSPVTITVRVGPSETGSSIAMNGAAGRKLGGSSRAVLVVDDLAP